ncbi:MAG: hypothetical protein IAA31_00535 [Candidatus Anaerobiospirillum merdipullorum]|uniref:Uncharacterized protein n=1 Tax=Candidatus Anaerobiospirillum merdipullorum TaxID=2838450 RepID=A0A9E2KM09_9GAMM|nr:hypothetical protein [Candidatus Anaerobiospirillum merdipullorum]
MPTPLPSPAVNNTPSVVAAPTGVNAAQLEHYQLCRQVLSYIQEVQRTATQLCAAVKKHPAASSRDLQSLHTIAKAIDAQQQARQAAVAQTPEAPVLQPSGSQPILASAPTLNLEPVDDDYARKLQASAQELTRPTPELESHGPLSEAEIALLTDEPLDKKRQAARAINQAVDDLTMPDDYASPLAANFASGEESSLALPTEPAPAEMASAPQAPLLPSVPDTMPEYMQEVPEPEEEFPPSPATAMPPDFGDEDALDEDQELEAQERSAQAMLFASAPQQGGDSAGAAVASQLATQPSQTKSSTRQLQPVQQLPTGYSLPKFKGLTQVTPEDFYPRLKQISPWYALIDKAKIPQGPERSALLYSSLVHEPQENNELELTMSEEYRTFILGGKALALLKELFSEYYGREISLKLNFCSGVPANAPVALVQQMLGESLEQQREALARDPFMQALLGSLEENVAEVMLTLYHEDRKATPAVPAPTAP